MLDQVAEAASLAQQGYEEVRERTSAELAGAVTHSACWPATGR